MEYAGWVERNKASACLKCDGTSNLEVHHLVELYHVIHGLWKLYGDEDAVVSHAMAMHEDDRCEAVTLCSSCHSGLHPGRGLTKSSKPVHTALWSAVPRILPQGVGLVGLQVLFGIGWHVMNGNLESGIVRFNRRRMAELIGKSPGTSFNACLDRGLRELTFAGAVLAHVITENEVEVHLEKDFLSGLGKNPWFFPVEDVATNSFSTLMLRWHLSHLGSRKRYKIGRVKLAGHLGISTKTPAFVRKVVERACEDTGWMRVSGKDEVYSFWVERRGSVPIFSLRDILSEVLRG